MPAYFCDRCNAPSRGDPLCRSCTFGAQQAAAADASDDARRLARWGEALQRVAAR